MTATVTPLRRPDDLAVENAQLRARCRDLASIVWMLSSAVFWLVLLALVELAWALSRGC